MIYDPKYETLGRADLEQLQFERLQMTLNRVYRNVAFYKNAFDSAACDIERVRTAADMRRLPFTTKQDLRGAYPYDMFAVPLRDIVRIHATSGTTGKAIATGYTRNDIALWAALVARQLAAVGVTEQDVVQVAFNYGLFTGGLGFHYGAEKIGASVIPASPAGGHVSNQNTIMKDYKATVLATMPSYALAMASYLEKSGVHPEQLFLRCALLGAEPWSESVREIIEKKLRVSAYDCYGVAELIGPGVAAECTERKGLHINEDHFFVEVIDPKTLEPVRAGETGELVFTTLTKEGFPLIRYRTGDLASLIEGTCACGRSFARMSRVQGRTDDLIFYRGSHVFPSQIQSVLAELEGIEPEFTIELTREDGIDQMEIKVAISEQSGFSDELRKLVQLKAQIAENLRQRFRVAARVTLVEASSLRGTGGSKMRRVIDKR